MHQQLAKLLFPDLKGKWGYLNLNEEARNITAEPNPLLDPIFATEWVQMLQNKSHIDYSHGGFLEDRSVLWRGHYQPKGYAVHLGVDFNVPCYSMVHLPVDAELIFYKVDADQNGGWGGQLIFKRRTGQYITFGHLKDIETNIGKHYKTGSVIGKIA